MKEETKKFISLIVKTSNKKAEKENMTKEEKKQYIKSRLFTHFENNDIPLDNAIEMYKSEYPDFEKQDFKNYVIKNTSKRQVVEEEKQNLEKKIKRVDWEILQKDRELGNGKITKFDLQCIPGHPVKMKLDEIDKKYVINVDEDEKLSEEQIQENKELIEEMIKAFPDIEELHEIAMSQSKFFKGMGKDYQETIKEKSPKYAEYIESSMKREKTPLLKQQKKLEKEKQELKEMRAGLQQCLDKIYIPALKKLDQKNKEEQENNNKQEEQKNEQPKGEAKKQEGEEK